MHLDQPFIQVPNLLRIKSVVDNSKIQNTRLNRLRLIREQVSNNITKAYNRYSHTYNLRSNTVNFEPVEIVLRKSFKQSNKANNFNSKLSPQYIK